MKKIAAIICLTFTLSACVHTPDYELCDTPNCGEPVIVEVE